MWINVKKYLKYTQFPSIWTTSVWAWRSISTWRAILTSFRSCWVSGNLHACSSHPHRSVGVGEWSTSTQGFDSMPSLRILNKICYSINQYCKYKYRTISSTAQLQGSWMEKVKNVLTGQKSTPQSQGDASQVTSDSFTLLRQFLLIPISSSLLPSPCLHRC